jgi:hypothetical protein
MWMTPDEETQLADEKIVAQVIALWNEGKSLRDIGTAVGKSHAFAREVLRQQGIDTSVKRPRDTSSRDGRVVELYTAPERPDVQQVSNATGLAYNTVRAILGRAGVLRDRGPESSPEAKRNRPAIPYRPSDETRAWLEEYAREAAISLDETIDEAVQSFRGESPGEEKEK